MLHFATLEDTSVGHKQRHWTHPLTSPVASPPSVSAAHQQGHGPGPFPGAGWTGPQNRCAVLGTKVPSLSRDFFRGK